jgi:hypothetical protein
MRVSPTARAMAFKIPPATGRESRVGESWKGDRWGRTEAAVQNQPLRRRSPSHREHLEKHLFLQDSCLLAFFSFSATCTRTFFLFLPMTKPGNALEAPKQGYLLRFCAVVSWRRYRGIERYDREVGFRV